MFQVIVTRLSNLLTSVQPREALVLAIDGVAPLAKIQQQRQRRYRAAEERRSGKYFDSNAITPGTQFMTNLDRELTSWISKNAYALPPKVIYSGHLTPGEGEHKIIDLLRAGEVPGNGAHVLYGLDADLIMLGLIAPVDKVFLMREDVRDVVNIDNLKVGLIETLGTQTAVNDFVVMMFFIGNDFLPHVPTMTDMVLALDTMFAVYQAFSLPLTYVDHENQGHLHWPNLATFLSELAKYEGPLLDQQAQKEVKYPSRMLAAATTVLQQLGKPSVKTVDATFFRNAWYSNALGPHGDDLAITTAELLNQNFEPIVETVPYQITEERAMAMFINYLNGLSWVYSYYVNGAAQINLNYIYIYSHAPMIIDIAEIAKYIPAPGQAPIEGNLVLDQFEPLQIVDRTFLNPLHQLLAVIPPKSAKVLPTKLLSLYEMESPIFDMFPHSFIIERDGVNEDWQGTVIIPPVEAERIKEAVADLSGIKTLINQYAAKPNVVEVTVQAVRERVENQARRQCGRGPRPATTVERGRGGYQPRGRGGSPTGRGGYQPRGGAERGGYQPRGGAERGGYQPRGGAERGGYQPRGRGGYQPRAGTEYQAAGAERGGYQPRGRGGATGRGRGAYTRGPTEERQTDNWKNKALLI